MTTRSRKKLFKTIVGLLVALLAVYLQQNPRATQTLSQQPILAGTYRVTEFVDGDTIAVDMNGKTEKVRMIGVDTPETKDPRVAVQCFGKAASDYTKSIIGTSTVRLESDPLNTNRDRYDRLLRYVYTADGRMVNSEIIKNGYGFAYLNFPFSKADDFRSLQKNAETQKVGLWGNCETNTQENGRQQTFPN